MVDVAVGEEDVVHLEALLLDQVGDMLELQAGVEDDRPAGVAAPDDEAVLVEVGVREAADLDAVGDGFGHVSSARRCRSAS